MTNRGGKLAVSMALLGLSGCATELGHVAFLGAEAAAPATKLLRPAVEGRSCRASLLGLSATAGEPSAGEALARILDLDREGDAVTNVDLRWEHVATGLYDRRCVVVRGDLVRTISTVTLPMPEGHHPRP